LREARVAVPLHSGRDQRRTDRRRLSLGNVGFCIAVPVGHGTRGQQALVAGRSAACWTPPTRWRRTSIPSCLRSCARRSASLSWPRCRRSSDAWKRPV